MYDQPQTREQLPQTDLRGADVTARWSVPLEPTTQMAPQQGHQGQPREQPPVQQIPQQPPSQAIPQQIASSLEQQPVAQPRQLHPQTQQVQPQAQQLAPQAQQVQPRVQQLQPQAQQLAPQLRQQPPQAAPQSAQPQSPTLQSTQPQPQLSQPQPQPQPQPVQRGTPTAQQGQQQAAIAQSSQVLGQSRLAGQPSVDLVETPEALSILVDLPGCEKREIELEGDERTLTISAKRTAEKNDGRFFYHERPEEVERTIDLPANVEIDDAEATYENGILTVTLPKTDDSRRKRIGIQ